ncbi:hypothetical protein EDB84DRAFT_1551529, partial [Lactarius hengduanensis]
MVVVLAAVVRVVAVRGTLDLEEEKKSRAEAESAAWEMLQHQLAPRTAPCGHATHHDAFACRQLAPHPAATDNVSFGPSRRRRLCLVARKSVAAASNPSPPPPAYHRHLQPIAAASDSSPHPGRYHHPLQRAGASTTTR